jgi:hypothetical protein
MDRKRSIIFNLRLPCRPVAERLLRHCTSCESTDPLTTRNPDGWKAVRRVFKIRKPRIVRFRSGDQRPRQVAYDLKKLLAASFEARFLLIAA